VSRCYECGACTNSYEEAINGCYNCKDMDDYDKGMQFVENSPEDDVAHEVAALRVDLRKLKEYNHSLAKKEYKQDQALRG